MAIAILNPDEAGSSLDARWPAARVLDDHKAIGRYMRERPREKLLAVSVISPR
jgi:hypothetical protein